jgi:hypothetical protein
MGTRETSQSRLVGKTAVNRPTATVLLSEDVAAADIHESLDRIFRLHGCTGCGLLGLDLRLLVCDPKLSGQLKGKGVLGMTLQP